MPIITSNDTTSYGTGSDLFKISTQGEVILEGEAIAYDDLLVPMTATKLGGSKDPDFGKFIDNGSGSQGVFAYLFDPIQEEELYFGAQLPHTYNEGTDIYPHIHFCPTSNNPGDVVFGLEYTWQSITDVFPNTNIIYVTATIDENTIYRHSIAAFDSIAGTNMNISSMLVCRMFRAGDDPNDTYPDDVAVLSLDFHHEVNSFGSRQEYIK